MLSEKPKILAENNICDVCGSKATIKHYAEPGKYLCSCPVCGRYKYYPVFEELTDFDLNYFR